MTVEFYQMPSATPMATSTAFIFLSGFSYFFLSHHHSLKHGKKYIYYHHTLYCLLRFLTPLYGVSISFIALSMYLAHKCSKHPSSHKNRDDDLMNPFGLLPPLTTVSCHSFCFYLFIYFSFIFISWRLITLQYCSGFCHTLT